MRSTSALIGHTIKVELLRRGMTQGALAEAAGMADSALSTRLSGKTPIDMTELDRLAAGLGMTAFELIESARLESSRRVAS